MNSESRAMCTGFGVGCATAGTAVARRIKIGRIVFIRASEREG
jgi:hypothetical protein